MQALASNGRWTGVPLKKILDAVGVKDHAREVVFFGADSGTEEVEFRGERHPVIWEPPNRPSHERPTLRGDGNER